MPVEDQRVTDYIASSAEFAQPILAYLRGVVHEACPQVEETMKWSCPHFMYKGMFCGIVAFKAHAAFTFWKGEQLLDMNGEPAKAGRGHFGKLTSLKDLPPKKEIIAFIKQAMKLNDEGPAVPKPKKERVVRELIVPEYFVEVLKANEPAHTNFLAFSTSHKREYVEWLEEAKTEPTRLKRLAQAVEWIAEGKSRNWKYANC